MSTATAVEPRHAVVDAILRANEGRKPDWARIKYERMGEDVFAFFRGTNHLFAAGWAALAPRETGPSILLGGDLHLENFGAYRAEDGSFAFDVNDFDEATVGPSSIDLVRCATSIFLAAEVWKLRPIQATRMVLGFVDSYRSTIAEGFEEGSAGGGLGPVEALLNRTAVGTRADLLARMTRVDKSGEPSIRRSSGQFPMVGKAKAGRIAAAIEAFGRAKGKADSFRVLDVVDRIAGIGSLGVRRHVALVAGDGPPDGAWLLDIKEARPSSLAGCAEGPKPENWTDDARRVVDAQRRLQAKPTAGLDILEIDGRMFRVRDLIPSENRSRLDSFRRKPSQLRRAVEVAGRITARSQLRGARPGDGDRTDDLRAWAAGPAADGVLAAAIRFADQSRDHYKAFKKFGADLEA